MALADYKPDRYLAIKKYNIQEYLLHLEHRIEENEKAERYNNTINED